MIYNAWKLCAYAKYEVYFPSLHPGLHSPLRFMQAPGETNITVLPLVGTTSRETHFPAMFSFTPWIVFMMYGYVGVSPLPSFCLTPVLYSETDMSVYLNHGGPPSGAL